MPFQQMQFPMLSFEQANPGLTAASAATSTINQTLAGLLKNQQQVIQNQYLPQFLKEQLLKEQYANQLTAPQIPLAGQTAQATLANLQAIAPNMNAQTIGQQYANRMNAANLPYAERNAEAKYRKTLVGLAKDQLANEQSQQLINILRPRRDTNQNQMPSSGMSTTNPLGDTSTNQGPMIGNVAGIPMSQPEINAYQQVSGNQQVAPSQQPGLGQDQLLQLQTLADIQAAKSGKPIPSLQAGLYAKEATAKEYAKSKNELGLKYSSQAITSQQAENELNEWEKAYDATPARYKGHWTPEWFAKQNPNAQVALKTGANLMLTELRPLFGGLGQVRVAELNMLASGNPNLYLDPPAAKKIVNQVRTALKMKSSQNNLYQKLSQFTDNPALIETAMANIMALHNPVNLDGTIDKSKIDDWMGYATRDFLNAVANNNIQQIKKLPNGKSYIKINNEWYKND